MNAARQSIALRVADESGVGEARRAARAAARGLGLGEVAVEQAAIVAAEAARNAVVHAGGGRMVLTPSAGRRALEILALDQGPGIADLRRALEDGYSTAGSAGQGLGAITRLAAEVDVYSAPGKGTALLARVGQAHAGRAEDVQVGAISVPAPGEAECGDGWAVERAPGGPACLVVDGLGHGKQAAEAAVAAEATFRQRAALPLEQLLDALHRALRPTRGAAVAVAQAMPGGQSVRYGGIGNIAAVVHGSLQVRKMVSIPGTAGHAVRSIRAFDYPWPPGALLIMHSDGISGRWDLAQYPGLAERHPSLVAGVLLRDFGRTRDDATVLVVRRGP